MSELKLTQIELFSFFQLMCAAASELFCMAHLANNERFFLSFYPTILNIKFYMHVN